MNYDIKSPLIYPGSKGSVLHELLPLITEVNFKEYREPFVGSASIYLAVRQQCGGNDLGRKYWINDLNLELFNFWKMMQRDTKGVIEKALEFKNDERFQGKGRGKELFYHLKRSLGSYKNSDKRIELAAAYYILNRSAFSGGSLVSGFSQDHYDYITDERIKELGKIGKLLMSNDVRITHLDYQEIVEMGPMKGHSKDDVIMMCCIPGTKIRMKDERLLNIEDVEIGDITFMGGNVINTFERNYIGKIYEFVIMGLYDNLCVTEEHPLAVIRKHDVYKIYDEYHDGRIRSSKFKTDDELNSLEIVYVNAKDLDIGDFVLLPCYPENITNIQTIKIGNKEIKCDEYFGLICGLYLAEGGITTESTNTTRRDGENTIKLGKKSLQFLLDRVDIEKKIDKIIDKWFIKNFGISGEKYTKSDTHIVYYMEELIYYFDNNFGNQSYNKKISNVIMNLPLEFQMGLLRGWLLGDSGTWKDERNRIKLTGSTVSNQLAINIYTISLRLGLRPSSKIRRFENFEINDIYFSSNNDVYLILEDSSIKNINIRNRNKRKIITKDNKKYILTPITNIVEKKYIGKVYNLSTENHLYVANFVLSHNCDPPYWSATESGLYGQGGKKWDNTHKTFDHYRFAKVMKECKFRWLITYDDSPFIRNLFKFANQKQWTFTHKMRKDKIGRELLVSNFTLKDIVKTKQLSMDDYA